MYVLLFLSSEITKFNKILRYNQQEIDFIELFLLKLQFLFIIFNNSQYL